MQRRPLQLHLTQQSVLLPLHSLSASSVSKTNKKPLTNPSMKPSIWTVTLITLHSYSNFLSKKLKKDWMPRRRTAKDWRRVSLTLLKVYENIWILKRGGPPCSSTPNTSVRDRKLLIKMIEYHKFEFRDSNGGRIKCHGPELENPHGITHA